MVEDFCWQLGRLVRAAFEFCILLDLKHVLVLKTKVSQDSFSAGFVWSVLFVKFSPEVNIESTDCNHFHISSID